MRWTAIPLSLLAFLLLYLLFLWSDSDRNDGEVNAANSAASINATSSDPVVDEPEATAGDSPKNCLTEQEVRVRFMRELEYMNQVSLYGEYADSYAGNSAEQLESLAMQGDSAAMAVLGVQYLLVAHDLDPQGAPSVLNPLAMLEKRHPDHEAHTELVFPKKQDYTDEQLVLMDKARYWLFESAVHGRYLSMELVGAIDGRVAGDAVGQGWISQEDYELLSREDKASIHPYNVFRQAGLMLLPEGGDGVVLEIAHAASRLTDRGNALAAKVAATVTNAQAERGVSPRFVDTSAILSSEELMGLLCEDVRARILEGESDL